MIVLAFDTAMDGVSVALRQGPTGAKGGSVVQARQMCQSGHAELLMPMIRDVIGRAGVPFTRIQRLAVTLGPGSFTGVRTGIAAARGFRLAAGVEIVGMTTLALLAHQAFPQAHGRPVLAAADARRGRSSSCNSSERTRTTACRTCRSLSGRGSPPRRTVGRSRHRDRGRRRCRGRTCSRTSNRTPPRADDFGAIRKRSGGDRLGAAATPIRLTLVYPPAGRQAANGQEPGESTMTATHQTAPLNPKLLSLLWAVQPRR